MALDDSLSTVQRYLVKRKSAGGGDPGHSLVVVRADRVVATLSDPEVKSLVGAAPLAGRGYGADSLALIVEAVLPLVAQNPVTGAEWKKGEAEQLWFTGEGITRGWVTEILVVAMGSRTGEVVNAAWPFRVDSDSVTWQNESMDITMDGAAERLTRALDHDVADPARVPDPGELFVGDAVNGPFHDPARGRTVLDIGTTRVLSNELQGGNVRLVVATLEAADEMIADGLLPEHLEVYAG